ncbi:MAG: PKD domain-containing protein, partial [Candidatus Hydrogenedentes bacterium]|nr:PKD domain-containing protein [Candidatus Hydrogenedentota bacterium]
DCVLTYIERQDNAIVASATAYARIVDLPAIHIEVDRGERVVLNGPAGFSSYSWKLEDTAQGKESVFTHSFQKSGVYRVVVSAQEPLPGWPQGWQRFFYVIHVR